MHATKTSGIVVGGRKPGRFGLRSRLAVLAGGSMALVALIAIGALWATGQFSSDNSSQSAKSSTLTPQQKVDQAVNKTTLNPDYSAAEQELQSQLKVATSNTEKTKIYNSLTVVALHDKQYQKVIEYETLAAKLSPELAGYYALPIADAYAALGDKQNATKYYQTALTYFQARPETFTGKQYYIADVTNKLKAQQ